MHEMHSYYDQERCAKQYQGMPEVQHFIAPRPTNDFFRFE